MAGILSWRPALRWRPRITLRWLLVTLAMLVVWLGNETRQATKQREAVARLSKLGAIVRREPAWLPEWIQHCAGEDFCRRVESVTFMHWDGPGSQRVHITDAQLLEYLPNCRGLRFLGLDGADLNGTGLEAAATLDCLEVLSLRGREINDNDLRHLSNLTRLKGLFLFNCNISDEGLPHLHGLANLQDLRLYGARITDAGLASLLPLQELRFLGLSNTQVSDNGIEHLRGFPELRHVELIGTGATLQGLRELAPLTNLEVHWYAPLFPNQPCPDARQAIRDVRREMGVLR